MNFLKRLLAFLFDFTRKKTDYLGPLSNNETLARYVVSRRHFSFQSGKLKAAAFIPPSNSQLSAFRTKRLSEREIWDLGEREVAAPTNRTICGRGDFSVEDVNATELTIDPDDHPPRHTNIIGWPTDKAERKAIAQLLAERAIPILKP